MVWGDCLPACPAGAITFEEREAAAYDAEAVRQKKEQQNARTAGEACSRLGQWPVQIKLVPVKAPYFDRAPSSDRGRLHSLRLRGLS